MAPFGAQIEEMQKEAKKLGRVVTKKSPATPLNQSHGGRQDDTGEISASDPNYADLSFISAFRIETDPELHLCFTTVAPFPDSVPTRPALYAWRFDTDASSGSGVQVLGVDGIEAGVEIEISGDGVARLRAVQRWSTMWVPAAYR